MDVMTAILTRRSEHHLTEPAPSDLEFAFFLSAAATSPDHGLLRPWRWILIRGDGRHALGACFAEHMDYRRRDQVATKPLQAPLLATLVFTPRRNHKIPEWEQLAATCAMTQSLILLLHDRGFGNIWRTGRFTESNAVHQMLDLQSDERLLGWLYIGTPHLGSVRRLREPVDITDRLSTFTAPGLTALRADPDGPDAPMDVKQPTTAFRVGM